MSETFEKEIDGTLWILNEPNVTEARKLQLRIPKVLGGPFVALFSESVSEDGSEIEEGDEFIPLNAFSKALASVDVNQSVALITDLCELTINRTKQRKTDYNDDFSMKSPTDVKVALWVVDSIFANFIEELFQSGLEDQIMDMMPKAKE